MEEPEFVKCEPAWPSDTEQEPSNFAPPLDKQVKIEEDPDAALDEIDLGVVKDEDEIQETLDEECDNSGDSPAELHCSVFSNHPLTSKTEGVSWDCSSCGKSFKDKGLLKKHVVHNMKHLISSACCPKDDDCPLLGKGPYPCEKCDRKFSQRKNLNQHMSTHMEDKPFSCSFCSKCFSSKPNLKYHILTHTGDRPHVCPRCGLAFARACGLNRHKATHTLSRPFACSTCGKAFRHRRSWQKHAAVHSGEKPFLCEKCGGLFSLKGNLKAHMLVHLLIYVERCRLQTAVLVRYSTSRNIQSQ